MDDSLEQKIRETVTIAKFREGVSAEEIEAGAEPFEVVTIEDGVVVSVWTSDAAH